VFAIWRVEIIFLFRTLWVFSDFPGMFVCVSMT
jgi:hypothetical protein